MTMIIDFPVTSFRPLLLASGVDFTPLRDLIAAMQRSLYAILGAEHAALWLGAAALLCIVLLAVGLAMLGRGSFRPLAGSEATEVLARLSELEGLLREQKNASGGTISHVRGELSYLKQELAVIREAVQQLQTHMASVERSVLLAPSIARAERRTTDSHLQRFTVDDTRRDPVTRTSAAVVRSGNG